MSKRISDILQDLVKLTENEQREIISILSNMLIRGDLKRYSMEDLTEKRFAHDKKCPYCDGTAGVIKNGLNKGRQRFYCKLCKKTFGERKNTIMFSSKRSLEKWMEFAWCLVRGFSLKRCHEEVGISVRTAFFWRHKLMLAIGKFVKSDQVDGIVEADETYFLESFKGQKNIDWKKLGRRPFRRGGSALKRGLSKEQVCVICCLDRLGHILSDMVGKSRPDQATVDKFFKGRITPNSILCTDTQSSFSVYAKANGIQIKQIPTGKHKIDIYHIQHVNSYHSSLKGWLLRFKGVSTKYLNNYLYWFKWLTSHKELRERDNSHSIISTAYTGNFNIRWSDFGNTTLVSA
jgi:transposase-like protein